MQHMVQVRISERTHQRLKLAAALLEKGLAETADELLRESAEGIIDTKAPSRSDGRDRHAD